MDDDLDAVQRDKIYVFWWTDIESPCTSQSQSSTGECRPMRGLAIWICLPASQRWCGRSLIRELMLIGQWMCQSSSPHRRVNSQISMHFCTGGVSLCLCPSVAFCVCGFGPCGSVCKSEPSCFTHLKMILIWENQLKITDCVFTEYNGMINE